MNNFVGSNIPISDYLIINYSSKMKKHHGFDLVEEKSGKTKIYADENIDSNLISYLKDHHRINIIYQISSFLVVRV